MGDLVLQQLDVGIGCQIGDLEFVCEIMNNGKAVSADRAGRTKDSNMLWILTHGMLSR